MDYIREFDIRLEKEMYYAGELLQGQVILNTVENFKLRGECSGWGSREEWCGERKERGCVVVCVVERCAGSVGCGVVWCGYGWVGERREGGGRCAHQQLATSSPNHSSKTPLHVTSEHQQACS